MNIDPARNVSEAAPPGCRSEDRAAVGILVVSPRADIRQQLRERLDPARWRLVEVAAGAAAFEYLYGSESDENECEVLLLDPMLPDLEPVEFAAMVRLQFPEIQVLTLSSQREGPGAGASRPEELLVGAASPTAVSSQLAELLYRNRKLPSGFDTAAPDGLDDLEPHSTKHLADSSSRTVPINGPLRRLGPAACMPAANHAQTSGQVAGADALDRPAFDPAGAEAGAARLRRTRSEDRPGIRGMVGRSGPMQRVYALAHRVAARDTTVVVTGESGTGKDLVAQAIHLLSPRQRQPFVVINCAAIPEPLLEAELFGYVKGSFTGATQSRIGRIHAAHGGTLFLDEIGDMPLALQSKILRFLEQGEVQRLGGNDNLKVDVRVVAATNADLKASVERRLFREDLYYRLMVFPILLPPLRERMDDLAELAETFLGRFSPGAVLGPDALSALEQHGWPGNVRELRNVIERASILAGVETEIRRQHISL